MSLEDFQLLDNEPLDNSIIKRDFTKIYHRQGDQLNQSDQNIEFIFGENNNYQEYTADPENAKFYLIVIRRREIELISDGNKLIEVKVI